MAVADVLVRFSSSELSVEAVADLQEQTTGAWRAEEISTLDAMRVLNLLLSIALLKLQDREMAQC